jgi:hypothetical protein
MMTKHMTLTADLRDFLDEEGNVLELTEQAEKIFKFLSTIVLSVSKDINQPIINVDLTCNSRADSLSCEGSIEAKYVGIIEWHCDTCAAEGSISHWQGSMWDKQKRTIH